LLLIVVKVNKVKIPDKDDFIWDLIKKEVQ